MRSAVAASARGTNGTVRWRRDALLSIRSYMDGNINLGAQHPDMLHLQKGKVHRARISVAFYGCLPQQSLYDRHALCYEALLIIIIIIK